LEGVRAAVRFLRYAPNVTESNPYGRYRPLVSPELLEWIERTFVASAPAGQQEHIRKAALVELAGAELELLPGDVVVSRAGEKEWFRVRLPRGVACNNTFEFEKAPGVAVRIERDRGAGLVAHQAGRPSIRFEKVN
jgi:hypothetical protein